jgi:hypothetical protein
MHKSLSTPLDDTDEREEGIGVRLNTGLPVYIWEKGGPAMLSCVMRLCNSATHITFDPVRNPAEKPAPHRALSS